MQVCDFEVRAVGVSCIQIITRRVLLAVPVLNPLSGCLDILREVTRDAQNIFSELNGTESFRD